MFAPANRQQKYVELRASYIKDGVTRSAGGEDDVQFYNHILVIPTRGKYSQENNCSLAPN